LGNKINRALKLTVIPSGQHRFTDPEGITSGKRSVKKKGEKKKKGRYLFRQKQRYNNNIIQMKRQSP